MKGKRIGLLTRGSCPEWFIRGMLVARGFDPDSHLVYAGLYEEYPRIAYILSEGRIDAGIMVEPNMSLAESLMRSVAGGAVYEQVCFQNIRHRGRAPCI
jgi:hypothetical protein